LRDDEVEEDDFYEKPRSLKKLHPKTKKVIKHGKKGRKPQHKKSHSVKPIHHQRAHQTMHASDFENTEAPVSTKGHMDSDDFTKGRFDTSETLVQGRHHGHAKKHHLSQSHRHHSAPPNKVTHQQAAHVEGGVSQAE
jgi:hypothetical protein